MLEITWTCVQGARKRCRPRDGGTGPASVSSGPGNALERDRHASDVSVLTLDDLKCGTHR